MLTILLQYICIYITVGARRGRVNSLLRAPQATTMHTMTHVWPCTEHSLDRFLRRFLNTISLSILIFYIFIIFFVDACCVANYLVQSFKATVTHQQNFAHK